MFYTCLSETSYRRQQMDSSSHFLPLSPLPPSLYFPPPFLSLFPHPVPLFLVSNFLSPPPLLSSSLLLSLTLNLYLFPSLVSYLSFHNYFILLSLSLSFSLFLFCATFDFRMNLRLHTCDNLDGMNRRCRLFSNMTSQVTWHLVPVGSNHERNNGGQQR